VTDNKVVKFSRREKRQAQSGGVAGICFAVVGVIIAIIAIKAIIISAFP